MQFLNALRQILRLKTNETLILLADMLRKGVIYEKKRKNNAEGNDKKRNGVALVIVTVIAIIFIPIAFLAGKLLSENGALIKLPGVNVTKNFEVTSVFFERVG